MAVIGNGNVALDVARLLAKSADEMAKSDIVPEAGAAIAAAPLTDIYVIGRRGAEHASFTSNELAEMGRLARAVAVADASGARRSQPPASDPTPERLRKAKNLEILKGFAGHKAGEQADHRAFPASMPRRSPSGPARSSSRPAPCRPTWSSPASATAARTFPEREGVFPVGWARRGPSGTIPTNRADSHAVAQQVLAWLEGARSQERPRLRCRSPSMPRAGTASTRPRSRPAPPWAGLA